VETLVTLLASTLIGTAFFLARLPVSECPECTHCRAEKLVQQREAEQQASRMYGIPYCPTCERNHAADEPHRRAH